MRPQVSAGSAHSVTTPGLTQPALATLGRAWGWDWETGQTQAVPLRSLQWACERRRTSGGRKGELRMPSSWQAQVCNPAPSFPAVAKCDVSLHPQLHTREMG